MRSNRAWTLLIFGAAGCVTSGKDDTADSGRNDDTGATPNSCEDGGAVITDSGVWYRTIQGALNGAVSGQELRICPGVHEGALDMSIYNAELTPLMEEGGTLTLVGADDGSSILDARGGGPVIHTDYVAFTIRDLTLTGGNGWRTGDGKDFPYTYDGGAILNDGGADLTLEHVLVEGNTATIAAAIAVRSVYGTPTISLTNSTLRGNVGFSAIFLMTEYNFTATGTTWEDNTPPDIHLQDVKMNGADYAVPPGTDVTCTSTPMECTFTTPKG